MRLNAPRRHFNVVINHARLQRTWSVKRNGRNNIRETSRRKAAEQRHVQRAFYLEQAVHVSRLHKREGAGIIDGDFFGNKRDAFRLLDETTRGRQHAKRAQAQEVHLQ